MQTNSLFARIKLPTKNRNLCQKGRTVTPKLEPATQKRLPFLLALIVLFVGFRVPILINPGEINSDGAVTGLQALQMLRGEFNIFHWGRDYLTSFDALVVSPFFAVFGATPLVLVLVTLVGQLAPIILVYLITSQLLGPSKALLLALPCVFMSMATNVYLYFCVRQWCIALAFLAVYFISRATELVRPKSMLVLGIISMILSTGVDLFSVQLVPPVALLVLLSSLVGVKSPRQAWPKLLFAIGGVIAGGWMAINARAALGLTPGRATLLFELWRKNWPLLKDLCLPWLFGTKVIVHGQLTYELQRGPLAYETIAPFAIFIPLLAIASGAGLFFFCRIPYRVRIFGAFGSAVTTCCLIGFIFSITTEDVMAARLLFPLLLSFPLACAPLAWLMPSLRSLAILLSPYLVTAAVGGWLSNGVLVDGVKPVQTVKGSMVEDRALALFLREKGLQYAGANFWLAYRLSLIFKEQPIVIPIWGEELYPRWFDEFNAANKVAYISHPHFPPLDINPLEAAAKSRGQATERFFVSNFDVLVVQVR
jgi:hypothetical protein